MQLAFRVPPADVQEAATQLAERDIELFGHRTLFFADPEHNVIEVDAEIEH